MKYLKILPLLVVLLSCTSMSIDPNVYVMDRPNNNLRASDPNNDRHISDCDPETLPSGKKSYRCVAHFLPDYQALLKKITDLQAQLDACQNSH